MGRQSSLNQHWDCLVDHHLLQIISFDHDLPYFPFFLAGDDFGSMGPCKISTGTVSLIIIYFKSSHTITIFLISPFYLAGDDFGSMGPRKISAAGLSSRQPLFGDRYSAVIEDVSVSESLPKKWTECLRSCHRSGFIMRIMISLLSRMSSAASMNFSNLMIMTTPPLLASLPLPTFLPFLLSA